MTIPRYVTGVPEIPAFYIFLLGQVFHIRNIYADEFN